MATNQGGTKSGEGPVVRIAKATLASRWTWTTLAGLAVFAVLASLDVRLKAETGAGTFDLGPLASAVEYHVAFRAWAAEPFAGWAGFDLGLAFLLIPLYAASFFYSGILAAEGFAPRAGRLRRLILLAAMVPPVGALFDAAGHALQFTMLAGGPSDGLAGLAYTAHNARNVGVTVGLILLAGALVARFSRTPQSDA